MIQDIDRHVAVKKLKKWLKSRWGKCQRCVLKNYRSKVVLGDLNPTPLLIIGEGPGNLEDTSGHPFVGRSGQEMRKQAKAIGIDLKTDASIINIVACRPPNNRDPRREEILSCWPRLDATTHLLKPKAILLVGRVASQWVLARPISVTLERGNVTKFYTRWKNQIEQQTAIVTTHPAFWLRNKGKGWEEKFREDLRLAWEIANDTNELTIKENAK